MRDDMTFTNRAAPSSIWLFHLCRYEIKINTTQVPPLWQDVHPRSSESRPPILLPRSRVSAREQIRQPAQMVAQDSEFGSFPRRGGSAARAGMAENAPGLLEEKKPRI
jgi:hypothetical protein